MAMLAAILLGALLPSAAAARPSAATVGNNEAEYQFAEAMTFTLDAEAPAGIVDVVLRFQVDEEDVHNRRIPEFSPGRRIRAEHREPLPRGALHPTAEVTWWWTLTDGEGQETVTPRNSILYVDEQLSWEVLDGYGLRVWHHDLRDDQAEELADMAGRAIDALDALVGLRVDRPIEVVAYKSQTDLRRALSDRGAVYESRLATLGARVADDTVVLDLGSSAEDLEEVMYHELSHIVLHLHLGPEWVLVPAWLDEGLAMYAEGELSSSEQGILDRALRDDEVLSVRSLTAFPGDAAQVSLAYAQSKDLVAFLVEDHPPEQFRSLLDRLVGGDTTFDEALAAEYGYDSLSMYQAYRDSRGLAPAVVPAEAAEAAETDDRSPASSDASDESANAPGEETSDGGPPCLGWIGLFVLSLALVPRSLRRRGAAEPELSTAFPNGPSHGNVPDRPNRTS